ncbi:DMT family transporter [Angustibacter sp. McL0619]|uniref:DMT family transporter n=1 Tax=Angustibacter sp. McL0619 TaxID=3415676 RepID=UPI003CF50053
MATTTSQATPSSGAGLRGRLTPIFAISVTVLLWASAFVAIRHVGDQVSPGALTLGRCVVASVVLGALLVVRHLRGPVAVVRPTRGQWLRLAIVGVLWFGAYNVALNAAEQRLDAGTAAMLVNVGPIMIAVLAGLLLGEGFPQRLLVGSLVAFAGVVLIGVSSSSPGAVHTADAWGVVLCVGAAAAYAVSVIAQKPLLASLPALEVTWIACTIGGLCALPFAGALWHDLHAAGLSALGWVVYLGVMPTAVAFTTWAYALARSTAGRLGSTTYLVPPLTIVLGWALLGETPAGWALVGGAVCLVGVAISRRVRRPTEPVVTGVRQAEA